MYTIHIQLARQRARERASARAGRDGAGKWP